MRGHGASEAPCCVFPVRDRRPARDLRDREEEWHVGDQDDAGQREQDLEAEARPDPDTTLASQRGLVAWDACHAHERPSAPPIW